MFRFEVTHSLASIIDFKKKSLDSITRTFNKKVSINSHKCLLWSLRDFFILCQCYWLVQLKSIPISNSNSDGRKLIVDSEREVKQRSLSKIRLCPNSNLPFCSMITYNMTVLRLLQIRGALISSEILITLQKTDLRILSRN